MVVRDGARGAVRAVPSTPAAPSRTVTVEPSVQEMVYVASPFAVTSQELPSAPAAPSATVTGVLPGHAMVYVPLPFAVTVQELPSCPAGPDGPEGPVGPCGPAGPVAPSQPRVIPPTSAQSINDRSLMASPVRCADTRTRNEYGGHANGGK